jgi:hypothetical protein
MLQHEERLTASNSHVLFVDLSHSLVLRVCCEKCEARVLLVGFAQRRRFRKGRCVEILDEKVPKPHLIPQLSL